MERKNFILKTVWGVAGFSLAGFTGGVKSLTSDKKKSENKNNIKMRMKTFDVPHKGIRYGLSQLSLLAGKTNYQDPKEIELLNSIGKEVFLILNTHAKDENDVSLKYLEEKLKGASHHDVEEHIRLHVSQSKLEKMLDEIHRNLKKDKVAETGSEFYTLLTDFHADYLQHMSEEESTTQQLLWDIFSDEELTAHRGEIMKNLHPDTLLLWFKYIAPAQSHQERVGLFKGFKANAPETLFNRAKEVLSEALTKKEYDLLMEALQ